MCPPDDGQSPRRSPPSPEGAAFGNRLKAIFHRYLEETPTETGPRIVQFGIMLVILANVTAVVVETVPTEVAPGNWVALEKQYPAGFQILELFSLAIFTVEYILRLWSSTVDPRFAGPLRGRLRFAMTPMALVDLLAILPSYFQVAGFMAARALRLVRVFRIFKLGHYSLAVKTLGKAVRSKLPELGVTVFVIGILLVLFSTVVYYVECDEPESKFTSIPATMWWGIVTLTTVGYGDISPMTPLGKLIGGIVSLFGIGLVALPAGILGSAFIQELSGSKEKARCPHCGKEI